MYNQFTPRRGMHSSLISRQKNHRIARVIKLYEQDGRERARGGVAILVNRGPEAIRGLAKYTKCIFLCVRFSSGTFLGPRALWNSQLSLYTRGKPIFHPKIFLVIYRRAFSSKSILLPVYSRA